MFPVTREFLLYVLGLLIAIMAVLLFIILRRRVPLTAFSRGEKKETTSLIDEQRGGGAYTRTGPVDPKSIKDKLLEEREPETMEEGAPEPEPQPEQEPPQDVLAPPPEYKKSETVPEPPPEPESEEDSNKPFLEEGVVEEGIELHDHPEELEREEQEKYSRRQEQPVQQAPPKPEPKPGQVPASRESSKSDDYFVLGEEYDADRRPAQKTVPKFVKRKELIMKGVEKPQKDSGVTAKLLSSQQPRQIEALKPRASGDQAKFSFKKVEGVKTGTPVESIEIAKDPKSFIGQSVSVEGELHLSSKGDEDAWYVLFDKSGSSIVRSKEEIPLKKCRITARVQKTKLGQIYLDVIRHEPL
jgi:hypothetical protein